ncbi:uncharacterized protein BO87DRAFT_72360 [Aspergillus neoniger CBS 115656]|uniref:Uncharacterized protein n=1 Tax=Aspergillus neoniger (strain CBS 115656) TaxID=1448310 RepID=A0A318YGU1_ASPNB|nr:hypothetical protein BO87DRAFT_72360 [Aspergillus neoniger CBS 115656]PYH33576.1 hypothetical protein BO87DRAFT_72360 [Aspergillus neoniger CBS 115656]
MVCSLGLCVCVCICRACTRPFLLLLCFLFPSEACLLPFLGRVTGGQFFVSLRGVSQSSVAHAYLSRPSSTPTPTLLRRPLPYAEMSSRSGIWLV